MWENIARGIWKIVKNTWGESSGLPKGEYSQQLEDNEDKWNTYRIAKQDLRRMLAKLKQEHSTVYNQPFGTNEREQGIYKFNIRKERKMKGLNQWDFITDYEL